MGTPLNPKYIPYTYMDALGNRISYLLSNLKGLLGGSEPRAPLVKGSRCIAYDTDKV